MMVEVSSHGSDQFPDDEQNKLAVLTYKPKATFHWPPHCLWPFIDRAYLTKSWQGRTIGESVVMNIGSTLNQQEEQIMIDLDQIKVTPREQQVLNLLMQGCSNREIGGELSISPRTVKQHLHTLFLRAGIHDGSKRVKLARYVHDDESTVMRPCEGLNPEENQISVLVWGGLTNREIGEIVGTSEQVVKNHLRSVFDKLGVWNRLELAMYVASHPRKQAYGERGPQFLETLNRVAPIPREA